MLGTILGARDKVSHQGVTTFVFADIKHVHDNSDGREIYVHVLLGLRRSNYETLDSQRSRHSQQRNILLSAWESFESCSQVKTWRFAQFWCVWLWHDIKRPNTAPATDQQITNIRLLECLPFSISSRSRTMRLSHLWILQGGVRLEEGQYGRRDYGDRA